MANREELGLIRGARAGSPAAQLDLGRRYLAGSAGLPKSLPTALHWLDRAAQQGCTEAFELIGAYIPVDVAMQCQRPVAQWYERAFDAGIARAGIVLAQLNLNHSSGMGHCPVRHDKALAALDAAVHAKVPEAPWLLAQYRDALVRQGLQVPAAPRAHPQASPSNTAAAPLSRLDAAWETCQWPLFLELTLPLARELVRVQNEFGKGLSRLSAADATLLSRCAQVLSGGQVPHMVAESEVRHFWELAASEHDRDAQLVVGLWYGRMRVDGKRIAAGAGSANFKKAIRWLTLAGEQGVAAAWYALSRIYIKPEFSQRNVGDAQRFLELAADMGYRDAQFECGNSAWRARRENENNDVRAVYWLQKAAAQGCPLAAAALHKIAPRAKGRVTPGSGALALPRTLEYTHPLLAARLELAALFRLTRAEALLLDVKGADQGHCLVIDIRASYGRSKRRLVLIDGPGERETLDRITAVFDGIDCGPNGPEGNYRQRLYRLKTLVPVLAQAMAGAEEAESDAYEMAA